jgi:hypothetical protein
MGASSFSRLASQIWRSSGLPGENATHLPSRLKAKASTLSFASLSLRASPPSIRIK